MTIYALVGHSASGKSSIERRLELKGIDRVVSYTTRPMRDGEEDSVDYHFISEDKFHEYYNKNGFFAEVANYRDWWYALSLDGIFYTERDYVVVVTPSGYEALVEKVGEQWLKAIFILTPERERLIRLANRGDDVDEIIRRIQADRDDFDGFVDKCDLAVNNKSIDESVELIYNIIKSQNKLGG